MKLTVGDNPATLKFATTYYLRNFKMYTEYSWRYNIALGLEGKLSISVVYLPLNQKELRTKGAHQQIEDYLNSEHTRRCIIIHPGRSKPYYQVCYMW